MNNEKDLLVMKFLHYFITEKNYNPVVVHGVQNEIWLENMDCEYRIIRLVLNHIHNNEQLDFDRFKVSRMKRQIKFKTFTLKMNTMSFYLDIDERVVLTDDFKDCQINATDEKEVFKNEAIKKAFPDMKSKLKFSEEGAKLYEKINTDILRKNIDKTNKINDLFKKRKPLITSFLIGVCSVLFILMYIFGNGSLDTKTMYYFGGLVKHGSPLRLITSVFLHIGILHLVMNMWALWILGNQNEDFYGHIKTFIIFIYSGVVGNLLSVIFMNSSTISAGASGAIFGLMGSLLYFSLNQRTYMHEALKNQILPVIIINLLFSFIIPSINIFAHLGGLVGGIIISMALGIKYKSTRFEKVNGFISSILLLILLSYFAYFV